MRPDIVTKVEDSFFGRNRLSVEPATDRGRDFLERFFKTYTPVEDE